jgi:hypothetical protein
LTLYVAIFNIEKAFPFSPVLTTTGRTAQDFFAGRRNGAAALNIIAGTHRLAGRRPVRQRPSFPLTLPRPSLISCGQNF